jgi:hypothetical protein
MPQRVSFNWDGRLNDQAHGIIIRSACSLRHLSMRFRNKHAYGRDLDTQHYMGDPGAVSCGLDRCKALPRTTRLSRIDYHGLFRGVDSDSCALFCLVSS